MIWFTDLLLVVFFCITPLECEDKKENCMESLGAAHNGYLPDSAFTASSSTSNYGPTNGRLNAPSTAWIPLNYQPELRGRDYLQVDLKRLKTLTSVSVQGMQGKLFVRSFSLMLSIDGKAFDPFYHGKTKKVFDGNIDGTSVVTASLPCPVVARFVRFIPEWFVKGGGIALKVDVFGCSEVDIPKPSVSAFWASGKTANSVTAYWKNVKTVEFFTLQYYPVANEEQSRWFSVEKKNATLPFQYARRISALSSCTKYRFILRAYATFNCGIPEVFTQEVLTDESHPPKPQQFDASNNEPNTLLLSWIKNRPGYLCADYINKFRIFHTLNSNHNQPPHVVEVDGSQSSYKLVNLQSWQTYKVWIVALSRYGQSDIVKDTFTVKGKPPTVPPIITTINSPKPGAAYVEWKSPPLSSVNGQIRGYTLNYRRKGNTKYDIIGLDVIQTKENYLIDDLEHWATFEVSVSLFNLQYHIQSDVVEVIVKGKGPAVAPTNLSSTSYFSSISLQWNEVSPVYLSSSFKSYQVFFSTGVKTSQSDLISVGEKQTTTKFEVTGLTPGTNYSFAVAVVSQNLTGPLSKILNSSTLPGPLPVPQVTFNISPPKAINISWIIDPLLVSPSSYFTIIYKLSSKLDSWEEVNATDPGKRQHTLYGLRPWTSYDISVVLKERSGLQSISNVMPYLVTDTAPGKAPLNIRVVKAGFVSVLLSWGTVDSRYVIGDIKSYVVRYSSKKGKNFKFLSSTKNNVTVKNLTDDTGYYFAVAVQTTELGIFSSDLIVKTQKIEAPLKPQILEVNNRDPYSISIKWKMSYNSSSDLNAFVIFILESADSGERMASYIVNVIEPSDFSHHALNVQPFTRYQIKMKLCVGGICSLFSDSVHIRTMEGKPTRVRDVKIVEKLNSVIVTWSAPRNISGILRKYSLNVMDSHNVSLSGYPFIVSNNATSATSLSQTLINLPANQKLLLKIIPFTSMQGESFSTWFVSPEGVPDIPHDVNAITIKDGRRVVIRWKEPLIPNGKVLGYIISWIGVKGYDLRFKDSKNITINNPFKEDKHFFQRIDNLVPGTKYEFMIAAHTSKGFGKPFPLSKSFITPPKAPIAPPKPIVNTYSLTSSTVIIDLRAGQELNGPIYSYQIIVEEIDPTKRRKRNLNGLTEAGTTINPNNSYIAAEISYNIIKSTHIYKFKVGNKKQYNGYSNRPLKAETNYKVHVGATTKDGDNNFLFGPLTSIELPTTGVAGETTEEVQFPIPVLIGIVFGLIIIVLVVVLVAYYIRRRRRRMEKDQMNPIELGLISVQQHDEDELDATPRKRPPSLSGDYPVRADHPPIPVSAFPKVVNKLHRNNNIGFKTEYSLLEIGKEFSWDTAHLSENKPKNRYANIVAYDHSRVILRKIDGIDGSDYINASFIDGYKRANSYISTQGPLQSTFEDFWRMIWEVHSAAIVMLTNLQEKNKLKCHKYWPDDSKQYGDILVTMRHREFFSDFTVRVFKLENLTKDENGKHEVREVRQFHFTCWPDHGVPNNPSQMINFRRKVRSFDSPDSGPTVIHCSAGVGRSGAYIAIDTTMDRAQMQNDVDIFNYISSIRTRRIAMVQTEDQYVFVHDVILEAVMTGDTRIPLQDLKKEVKRLDQIGNDSRVSGYENLWKTLNHLPIVEQNFTTGSLPENQEKNRYSAALPSDTNRVLLEIMNENVATSYINAAYVDSYKHRNMYILTQSPLTDTADDFWRMLCEHASTSLIMLNAIDEGLDFIKYWPDEGCCHYGPIKVECLPNDDNETSVTFSSLKPLHRTPCQEIIVRNFRLSDTRVQRSVEVRFFQYVGWTETRVPNSYRPIINLITRLEHWRSKSENGPITIVCSDGVGRSGTLAAILYTLERVKTDQVFDAFQAVKSIRIQRPHAVKKLNQYKYVHFAVQEYLTAFEESTKL